MGLSRRQFLKASASAAASTLLGRYKHIVDLIKMPGAALSGDVLSASSAPDYYSIFEMVVQGLYWPVHEPTYQRDAWMLDDIFDPEVVATYSQKALRDLYTQTVQQLHNDAGLIPDILKYKDQIPSILQLMENNFEAIVAQENPDFPAFPRLYLTHIQQAFSSFDKTMETIDHVLKVHKDTLTEIQRHMSAESMEMLSKQHFMRIIGTDIDIPYLFNLEEIKGVFEASWMNFNGPYAELLDVSPGFRNVLHLASQSSEARAKIAKQIIQGWDPYFNLDLADRHNLTIEDFTQGLKDALKEQMERDMDFSRNDPETLTSSIADSGNDFDNMKDDLAYILSLIEKRQLHIKQDTTNKDQPAYTFNYSGTSNDPRLCPEMDRIVDTFGTLMNKTVFSLERSGPAQITVQLNEDTVEWIGYLFEDYHKHASEVDRTWSFLPLLSRPIDENFGFSEILADARKIWPNLRF